MPNKTAIDWFLENMPMDVMYILLEHHQDTIVAAKKVHREQVVDALLNGYDIGWNNNLGKRVDFDSAIEYYDKKYCK